MLNMKKKAQEDAYDYNEEKQKFLMDAVETYGQQATEFIPQEEYVNLVNKLVDVGRIPHAKAMLFLGANKNQIILALIDAGMDYREVYSELVAAGYEYGLTQAKFVDIQALVGEDGSGDDIYAFKLNMKKKSYLKLIPGGIAGKLNMKKKAGYVYTAELLSAMTQGLERLSANYTADGAEAVVNFQSEEETEPQQYHIRITSISEIERQQEAEGGEPGYEWGPEGPPPGITNAVRLNMKKTSLEIGGETFPDSLKFKPHETAFLDDDAEVSILDIYQDAENYIVDYIWSGLGAHGITDADDANIIQEDVDEFRFNDASTLVRQLMEEGWFKFLEQSPNIKLKSDPELQQHMYNSIQTAVFGEGRV